MAVVADAETTVQAEAVALIDRGLDGLTHRELVSTSEMSDLLLDLRTILTASDN